MCAGSRVECKCGDQCASDASPGPVGSFQCIPARFYGVLEHSAPFWYTPTRFGKSSKTVLNCSYSHRASHKCPFAGQWETKKSCPISSIDGTCNNQDNNLLGAMQTNLLRLVDGEYDKVWTHQGSVCLQTQRADLPLSLSIKTIKSIDSLTNLCIHMCRVEYQDRIVRAPVISATQ